MNNTRRFDVGLQLVGQNTTTPDIAGEIRFNSSLNAFEYFDGTALRVAVSRDLAETLSNKTLTSTVSITGQAGSPLNISSATNQNLSLQAAGTGVVLVEDLSFDVNTVTGGASQLTIRSASTQDLALSAQGAGGSLLLNTNGNLRIEITDAGLINVPGLTASLPIQTDASKNLVSAAIALATSQVTGVLPIANGGTGSSTQNFVDLTTPQTVGGAKSFTSPVTVTPTTNQLVLGTTNTTTLNAPAPSASRVVTIPDAGTNSDVVLNQGTSTINGSKTFSSSVTITPTTNQLVLGTTNTTTINAVAPSASRIYTVPDVSANAEFVMSQGAQSIVGQKTFDHTVMGGFLAFTAQNDAIATGAAATVTPSTRSFVRLTNSSLTSIATIGATDTGRIIVVSNVTGNSINILNEGTGTASQRILTGTGADVSLDNTGSAHFIYDSTTARWRLIARSSAGGIATPVSLVNGGTNKALTPTAGGIVYSDSDSFEITAAGTTGQYISSNGTSAPTWASFTAPTRQGFTSGSGTYTTPAGVRWIIVKMVGGGGGGGNSGTGSFAAGGTGGDTTFGTSLLTANGGTGGDTPNDRGGSGGSFTINSPAVDLGSATGNAAEGGIVGISSTGSRGAGSFFGGGGRGEAGGAGVGGATNSGGGAAGAGSGATAGSRSGAGGGSGGFVWARINNPSATYSYAVGSGGSSASAGTNGFAGGTGGSGLIVVEEYYQ